MGQNEGKRRKKDEPVQKGSCLQRPVAQNVFPAAAGPFGKPGMDEAAVGPGWCVPRCRTFQSI